MKKQRKNIPVSKVGETIIATTMYVETDDTGEAWLTPEQIRDLKEARAYLQYLQANNRLRPGVKLIKRSRDTSKAQAARPVSAGTITAAFSELARKSWIPV